jgi:hypothetical protein
LNGGCDFESIGVKIKEAGMKNGMNLLVAVMVLVLMSGCLSYYEKRDVRFDQPPRVDIKFASAEASSIFHSKLSCSGCKGKAADGKHRSCKGGKGAVAGSRGCILFLYAHETKVYYPNARFNMLVSQADIDHNGMITVKEATDLK